MLPARIVGSEADRKICSTREVVVVFPFEPVMPISLPLRNR